MNRRGWTLVEILVVIAIVAIVAALLTTAFQTAIWSAKVSTCTQDLSSIGKAYDMYCEDNGGFLPPYFENAASADHPDQSQELVNTMLKFGVDKNQFFCPLDQFKGTFDQKGNYDHTYKSYTYSIGFSDLSPKDLNYLKINVAALPYPSQTYILMDAFIIGDPNSKIPMTGHGSWVNILFGDWHVKHVPTPGFDFDCTFPGQSESCKP